MATATNFDFTGSSNDTGPTGSFTDNGVTFTFSATGTGSFGTSGYFPARTATGTDVGQLLVLESHIVSAADATLLLSIFPTLNFTKFTGSFQITAPSVSGTWQVIHNMATVGTFTASNNTITVTAAQSGGRAIRFVNTTAVNGNDALVIGAINGTINCFCAGTRITTPDGPVSVETLKQGDTLITADGGKAKVKWLGSQEVDVRLNHPAKVNPICITAGAIADGVPCRDLWVSQDHAVAIDDVLINAGALVNGRTIYQVRKMPQDGFRYYHVETDAHDLLLAENTPAESFIDYAGRASFESLSGGAGVVPVAEMNLPRISTARLIPEDIQQRLKDRAAPVPVAA